MNEDRHDRSGGQGQGMNWIRKEKRLAIYLRDGLACAYCGESVEDGAKLTLDHLKAHKHGGSNDADNLVTCCHTCNSARGKRSWRKYAAASARYLGHGVTAAHIVDFIEATIRRGVDTCAAKNLIAQRGGFSAALQTN